MLLTIKRLQELITEAAESVKAKCVLCLGHNKGWEEAASEFAVSGPLLYKPCLSRDLDDTCACVWQALSRGVARYGCSRVMQAMMRIFPRQHEGCKKLDCIHLPQSLSSFPVGHVLVQMLPRLFDLGLPKFIIFGAPSGLLRQQNFSPHRVHYAVS